MIHCRHVGYAINFTFVVVVFSKTNGPNESKIVRPHQNFEGLILPPQRIMCFDWLKLKYRLRQNTQLFEI